MKSLNIENDVVNNEGLIIEELSDTVIDSSAIKSTGNTAKIKLIDDEISIFKTPQGQETSFLLCGKCMLDGNTYAALFDTKTKQGHVVELEIKNGFVKDIIELDNGFRDEEWAVVSEFFNKNYIFESKRIFMWVWNTVQRPELETSLPNELLKKWGVNPNKLRTPNLKM